MGFRVARLRLGREDGQANGGETRERLASVGPQEVTDLLGDREGTSDLELLDAHGVGGENLPEDREALRDVVDLVTGQREVGLLRVTEALGQLPDPVAGELDGDPRLDEGTLPLIIREEARRAEGITVDPRQLQASIAHRNGLRRITFLGH